MILLSESAVFGFFKAFATVFIGVLLLLNYNRRLRVRISSNNVTISQLKETTKTLSSGLDSLKEKKYMCISIERSKKLKNSYNRCTVTRKRLGNLRANNLRRALLDIDS